MRRLARATRTRSLAGAAREPSRRADKPPARRRAAAPTAWGAPGPYAAPAPADAAPDPFAPPDLGAPPGYGAPPPYPPPPYGAPPPYPPPGTPGNWPGAGYPPYGQQTNGLAIASLVLGLVGWIPCGVGSVVAIVLGFVSREQIKRSWGRQTGGGMATAGIVLGFLGTAFWLAMIIASAVNNATIS